MNKTCVSTGLAVETLNATILTDATADTTAHLPALALSNLDMRDQAESVGVASHQPFQLFEHSIICITPCCEDENHREASRGKQAHHDLLCSSRGG